MAKKVRYARCKIDWNEIHRSSNDEAEYVINILNYITNYCYDLNLSHNPEDFSKVFSKMTNAIARVEKEKLAEVYEDLSSTQAYIAKIIRRNSNSIRKSYTASNLQNLQRTIDNIEAVMSSVDLRVIDHYEGDSYNFVKYVLSSIRNTDIVEMTLQKYPHFVKLRNEEGESLVDVIVDQYLKEIENYMNDNELSNTYGILYYDSILRIFISQDKFKDEYLHKEKNLKKILSFKEKATTSGCSYETKAKLTYWLNELTGTFEHQEQELNYEQLKYRTDINDSFDEGVLSEAKFINNWARSNYEVATNDDVFAITIDKAGTKDRDDALSVANNGDGTYTLGVHITDPLAYISTDSIIFDEAMNRTTSISLDNIGKISMIPEKLTKNLLSLSKKKYNYVNSYYIDINNSGEVESYYFKKEKIKIAEHFTFDEMNEKFSNGADNETEDKMVENLLELRNILSRSRRKDDLYERIKSSSQNISATNIIGEGKSEEIISLAMLTTNKTVAKYFAEKKYPFLYRNHVINSQEDDGLEYYEMLFAGDNKSKEYLRQVKQIYPSPYYDMSNSGHHGLGVPAYCHVTSPLRRLADLINSECLNELYYKQPTDADFITTEELVEKGVKRLKGKTKQLEIFYSEYYRLKKDK